MKNTGTWLAALTVVLGVFLGVFVAMPNATGAQAPSHRSWPRTSWH